MKISRPSKFAIRHCIVSISIGFIWGRSLEMELVNLRID
jgi:hypothetical protein